MLFLVLCYHFNPSSIDCHGFLPPLKFHWKVSPGVLQMELSNMFSDSEMCSCNSVLTKINHTFLNTFSDPDKSIIFLLKMKMAINLLGVLP